MIAVIASDNCCIYVCLCLPTGRLDQGTQVDLRPNLALGPQQLETVYARKADSFRLKALGD